MRIPDFMIKIRCLPGAKVALLILVLGTSACNLASDNSKETQDNQAYLETDKDSLIKGKALFQTHCKACHLLPNPKRLPKEIWDKHVLPLMANRMGLGQEYERLISPEERAIEEENNLIPKNPMIKLSEYELIKSYILSVAPDSLHYAGERQYRSKLLTQFNRKNISLHPPNPSLITGLKFNSETKNVWVSTMNGQVFRWKWNEGVTATENIGNVVVDFTFYKDKTYFTDIGIMVPSELSRGRFIQAGGKQAPLLENLHRPVISLMEDLDKDGIPEVVVGNFGKNLGSLSLFKKAAKDGVYTETKLLSIPGAVQCYIKDMNNDGLKDIVALFSQADESVYIFLQKTDSKFDAKRVLRFPPDYGTTDMIMVDYNKDGHMDIVTANGDNADYSIVLKDYHGLRIHINQGNNVFKETFFYPLYGATKLLADDFDQDGDIDFAINCFFPDYGNLLTESFVYLQNDNSNKYAFSSYKTEDGLPVKSLTLEKGDIDNDGDIDIILGNFSKSPVPVPQHLDDMWNQADYGLIVFENRLK